MKIESKANQNIFDAGGNPDATRRGIRGRKYLGEAIGIVLTLIFSFFLMFHTFSYDSNRHQIQISSKLWSDFGAHIPLIRSFSKGPNLTRLIHAQPIESPLFPGVPIQYHFGFYALVGLLEKLGIRLDWALNSLSALGFFGLLISVYVFSFMLFKQHKVSILSLLFFMYNGSLSFVSFFRAHPLSINTPMEIITNSRFPAFGPWDNGRITAFWTLNIYTNQRHLALSYAIAICIILMKKQPHITAPLLSILLFINYPAAAIVGLFLCWSLIIEKNTRKPILRSFLFTIPAYLLLSRYTHLASYISWQPGYLIRDNLTVMSFARFWIDNLGLHTLLIPLGIFLSPKTVRRHIAPPLILLFILPNLYKFSPDMINNHKFFNFFLIIGGIFSAYAIVCIYSFTSRFYSFIRVPIRHRYAQVLAGGLSYSLILVLLFFSTFSGIIDFFPILNDTKGEIPDGIANPDSTFIESYTSPTDLIANSTWFYHPASIAGRSLFSGYTYFTWSYGYTQSEREAELIQIYTAPTKQSVCTYLNKHNISWIELNASPESYLKPNWSLWKSLPFAYQNPSTARTIYKTDQICAYEPI